MNKRGPITLESLQCPAIDLPQRDHYLYAEELFRRMVETYDLTRVYQLELHPGLHCDLYHCHHCYGFGQHPMEGLIGLDDYMRMFEEVKDYVSLLQFGGVSTEPATHPEFVEIFRAAKDAGFICGLHTKGYRMNHPLRDVLTQDPHDQAAFVTFSLDASHAFAYRKIHGLVAGRKDHMGVDANSYFEKVVSNIRDLYALREARRSNLRINIAYLVMKDNFAHRDIAHAIDIFEDCCDVIRFSFPQARNDGVEPATFLSHEKREILESLQGEYANHPKVRILENSIFDARRQAFNYCFAQVFQAVVDKAGNVFPCPQTALKNYRWLTYGNVKSQSLSQLLVSKERTQLLSRPVESMKCRVCDRKDEAINP